MTFCYFSVFLGLVWDFFGTFFDFFGSFEDFLVFFTFSRLFRTFFEKCEKKTFFHLIF